MNRGQLDYTGSMTLPSRPPSTEWMLSLSAVSRIGDINALQHKRRVADVAPETPRSRDEPQRVQAGKPDSVQRGMAKALRAL